MKYLSLVLALCLCVPGTALNLKNVKKNVVSAAKTLPTPSATLKNVELTSLSFEDIEFLFTVNITNPYPININLDKVTCNFLLEKIMVFSTATPGGLHVPANGSNDANFSVKLTFQNIMKAAKEYSNSDRVALQLQGDIVIAIPGYQSVPGAPPSVTIPYSMTKNVPTFKPSVNVRSVKVELPDEKTITAALAKAAKPAVSAASVKKMYGDIFAGKKPVAPPIDPKELDLVFKTSFEVAMKNETKSALSFKSLNYGFSINNEKVMTGQTTDIVAQGTTALIKVVSDLSSKSLGASIVKAFQDKKANFTLDGITQISLPPDIKPEPLKLDFSTKGMVDF